MEISDIKIAIGAIILIVGMLIGAAYLAGVVSETMVIALASTAIAGAAGLAGFEAGSQK